MENDVVFMNAAGVPANGTTGANFAGTGSLYVNITTGILYINTGSSCITNMGGSGKPIIK
jgi:hypothetical protein